MNYLNFNLDHDADGPGKLTLEVSYEAFKGVGDCYIDLSGLKSTAEDLGRYPLALETPIVIEGGYFHDDMRGLKQVHLHFSAVARKHTGEIALKIILSTPDDEASLYKATMSCELAASYEQLSQISLGIAALAEGRTTEVRVWL